MNERPEIPPDQGPLYSEFADELRQMVESDQTVRREGRWEEAESVDVKNTERLSQIIDTIGWPTVSRVGSEAAHNAWLLVQHADSDPAFQRKCFDLMKQEPAGEVSLEDLAYLEDRVLVAEGKPQRYGTQFSIDSERRYGPSEIEDFEHVNERRQAAGMEPFEEYRAALEEAWKKHQDAASK